MSKLEEAKSILNELNVPNEKGNLPQLEVSQYCSCGLPFCVFTATNEYFLVKCTFNSIFKVRKPIQFFY